MSEHILWDVVQLESLHSLFGLGFFSLFEEERKYFSAEKNSSNDTLQL